MAEANKTDVLFIGAGPAGLAGAIKLKQRLNENGRDEAVVVIDKAAKPGQHNLSGAVFESQVLDELIAGWRDSQDKFVTGLLANEVKRDELIFLRGAKTSTKIPAGLVPGAMRHHGNHVIAASELVAWLADKAENIGVELYTGFAAREIMMENSRVTGVRLGEKGRDRDGKEQANYIPAESIEAKVTVFGEGSAGQLAEGLINKLDLRKGKNNQVYSLGVKEIVRLEPDNKFGGNRVIHTLGYPLPSDVFGGGTLYSMGNNLVAVALILSLDWRYSNFNPQQELQRFKAHPYIASLLEGGHTIAYGAKTLPEGGFYSLPELYADGTLIVGDDAGLTNVRKLKGLHYAIKSGIFAGEAIFDAIMAGDFTRRTLKSYEDRLGKSFVFKEMKAARNYRQVFARGKLYGGVPLSFLQQILPRLRAKPDYEGIRRMQLTRSEAPGIDRLTAVSLSGTSHREDEPSHISFTEEGQDASCYAKFGCHPCAYFCPAEVYKFADDRLILSPSNCVHCQTCRLKCPNQVIRWQVPEGGDGPRYKMM